MNFENKASDINSFLISHQQQLGRLTDKLPAQDMDDRNHKMQQLVESVIG